MKKQYAENEEIISAYNLLKKAVPDYNEPNFDLAEKVFLDFNDFFLLNSKNGLPIIYLQFIPKSLLPYPKNYIKCAYYIFLEKLKKENNIELFKIVQNIGQFLFSRHWYPDYEEYKKNLNNKKFVDDNLKDLNPREIFKKLYGVYGLSEEDYYSSPSSVDSTNEKLIHDFGVLPKIEEDVDWGNLKKNTK